MTGKDVLEEYLQLSTHGKKMLRDGVQLVELKRSGEIIHKGQQVSGAYLVTRGQLRVFTYTPQGHEATLYFIRPGETCVLALNCLFNDLRYPAWVESDADTEVAVIPGPLYRRLFEDEVTVQNMTVQALSTLVFRLMNELEQVHSFNLDQRLATFLLSHANDAGEIHQTQQELAGHMGTSREVIARVMQGFTAQGLVETRRGVVQILDTEGLAERVRPQG
jgi:CRP/FNR family transcriptional regulator, anaerobic regulatory protein